MFHLLFSFLLCIGFGNTSEISKELPNIKVSSFDGEAFDLHTITKNKNIKIISLWATWCGPCKKELNAVSKVHKMWAEKYGAEMIAISLDNKRGLNKAKKYAAEQEWDFTLLHDTEAKLMGALELEAIPFSMIVDGDGNIISTTEGYYSGYETDMEEKLKKLTSK